MSIQKASQIHTYFSEIFSESLSFYKKSPLLLTLIFAIPSVFAGILSAVIAFWSAGMPIFLLEMNEHENVLDLLPAIFFIIGLMILSMFFQYLAGALTIRAVSKIEQKKFSFVEVFKSAFLKIGKALMLGFRIFIYNYIWFFLLVYFLIFLSFSFFNEAVRNLGVFIGFFLFFFTILMVVLILIRTLRTVFAFPLLIIENITSKEALQRSIDLSKDISGRIFLNYLGLGLVNGGIIFIFSVVAFLSFPDFFLTAPPQMFLLRDLIIIPLSIPLGCFTQIFHYVFLKKAQQEKKHDINEI